MFCLTYKVKCKLHFKPCYTSCQEATIGKSLLFEFCNSQTMKLTSVISLYRVKAKDRLKRILIYHLLIGIIKKLAAIIVILLYIFTERSPKDTKAHKLIKVTFEAQRYPFNDLLNTTLNFF